MSAIIDKRLNLNIISPSVEQHLINPASDPGSHAAVNSSI